MNLEKELKDQFLEARSVLDTFIQDERHFQTITSIATLMSEALKNGNKIISCGNGGSHCDAMHFAEELTGRYRENRAPLAAMAISDPSHFSCVGNDFGFEYVFSRFIEAFGNPGDIVLGISTSGNSKNVVEAFKTARGKNMTTVLLSGNTGGELKELADHSVLVPHEHYADRTQEIHIKIIHALIYGIEKNLNP